MFFPGISRAVTIVNSRTVTPCSHSGEIDIVDVLRRAGDFNPRLLARNGRSDNSTCHLFTLHGTAGEPGTACYATQVHIKMIVSVRPENDATALVLSGWAEKFLHRSAEHSVLDLRGVKASRQAVSDGLAMGMLCFFGDGSAKEIMRGATLDFSPKSPGRWAVRVMPGHPWWIPASRCRIGGQFM